MEWPKLSYCFVHGFKWPFHSSKFTKQQVIGFKYQIKMWSYSVIPLC